MKRLYTLAFLCFFTKIWAQDCPTISVSTPPTPLTVCAGEVLPDFVANVTSLDTLRWVYFSSQQTGSAMYGSAFKLKSANKTPVVGGQSTISGASLPNNTASPITYYLYATANGFGACSPYAEWAVTVLPKPYAQNFTLNVCRNGTPTLVNLTNYAGSITKNSGASVTFYTDSATTNLLSSASAYAVLTSGAVVWVKTSDGVCTNTTKFTINIKENPTVSASLIDKNCSTNTAILRGSTIPDADSVFWYNPSGAIFSNTLDDITVNQNGVYQLIAYSKGCAGIDTVHFDKCALPCPTISKLSPAGVLNICSGEVIPQLQVNSTADTIRWVKFTTKQTDSAMYESGTKLVATHKIPVIDGVSTVNDIFLLNTAATPTTVYIYATWGTTTDPNCRPFAEFVVNISPLPSAQNIEVPLCSPTATETVDLNTYTQTIRMFNSSQTVEYFDDSTLTRPISNINTYTFSNDKTIFAKVTNFDCFVVTKVHLTAKIGPTATINGGKLDCETGQFTINSSTATADSTKWFNQAGLLLAKNSSTLTVNSAGIYRLQVFSKGCVSIDTALVLNCSPACPELAPMTSSTLTVCPGEALPSLQVSTTADSVRWVYFEVPQTGTAMYGSANKLVANHIIKTQNGQNSVSGAILTNFTNSVKNYYVYATTRPTPADPVCRPYAEFVISVLPQINSQNVVVNLCEQTGETVFPIDTYKTNILNGSGGTIQFFTDSLATNPVNTATYATSVSTEIWAKTTLASCSKMTKLSLNIKPKPTVTATGGMLTCDQTSINLVAVVSPSADSLQWYASNGTLLANSARVTVYNPGTYTLFAYKNGCMVSDTAVVSQDTQAPIPALQLNTTATTLCPGETTEITSTACSGTIQWYMNRQPVSSFSPTSLTVFVEGTYEAKCQIACGSSPISNAIKVQYLSTPVTPIVTSDKTSICGTETAILNILGCSNSIQWYLGDNKITGETGRTYSASSPGTYSATCSNACFESPKSNTFTLTSVQKPQTPVISGGGTFCPGTSVTLSIANCNQYIAWTYNDVLISGQNNKTLTVSLPGAYNATCSNTCGTSDFSADATVVYTEGKPAAPVLSAGGSICSGGQHTINATGCTTGLNWYRNGTQLAHDKYSISVSEAGSYTAKCTNSCGSSDLSNPSVVSTAAELANTPVLSGTAQICPGSLTVLTATGCSEKTEWFKNNVKLADINNTSLSVSDTATYKVQCQGLCGVSAFSNAIKVAFKSGAPNAPYLTGGGNMCPGANISIVATNCIGNISWFQNGILVAGQSSQLLNTHLKGQYTAKCTSDCGTSVASNVISVGFLASKPAAPKVLGGGQICQGTTASLIAQGCVGLVKWYEKTIYYSNQPTLLTASTGKYFATCTNACGESVASDTLTVSYSGSKPSAPVLSGGVKICKGENTTIYATGCSGTLSWYRDQTAVSQANGPSLSVNTPGDYTATCTTSCGISDVSKIVKIEGCLEPPTHLTTTHLAANGFTLSWSPILANQNVVYLICLNGEVVAESSTTNYTFTNLQPSTNYQITVKALSSIEKTGPSEILQIRTLNLDPSCIPSCMQVWVLKRKS